MHELSIAICLLDLAQEEAERQGDAQVLAIHVKLGPLAGVVREALLSAYELARAGGPLEQAELIIEETPILANCPVCGGVETAVSVQQLACDKCGTPTPDVVSGRELEMVALEIQ